jgi:HSP20 family protein
MTFVQFKDQPFEKSFNSFMDSFLHEAPSLLRHAQRNGSRQLAPVNIRETENEFVLEVIAPGFAKGEFKIDLNGDLLTISAEKAESQAAEGRDIRKEYSIRPFKRSFTVDEKINAENIAAAYINGVLTLNLPKKAAVIPSTKEISIQ